MSKFVNYTYDEHLVSNQNRAEKEFLAKFEKEAPKLDNATVLVNPYLINPLSAMILFKTDKEVSPEMTIHGKDNARENIVHTFPKGKSHAIPVIGLYKDIVTKVTVKLTGGESKTFEIKAGEVPENTNHCVNIMTTIDYFGTDFMFLTPADSGNPIAIDYAGNLRWLFTTNTQFDFSRLRNGNILVGSPRFFQMPYHTSGLWEMNLLGKVICEYRMPGGSHHDQWELEDGNFMALTQDFGPDSTTVEDMIALIDRKTGKVLRTWDYKDFLPQDQGGSGSQDAHDWFHNNALWVDEKNKTITLSGRHQDAIVNFSYEENNGKGKLNWIIGDPEGWGEEWQKYFFKPKAGQKDFDWQYEQHACILLPDGDVMAFDNGQYRAKKKDKYIKNRDNFSRGVRYKIDPSKMEIEQVWQFGKELGQSFFSPYICNVEYYGDGHYLIHSGGIATVDGYASEVLSPFVSQEERNTKDYKPRSKTVEEKDGVIQFFSECTGNFYRAERLSPYHKGANLAFGDGKILGELAVTPTFDTIPDATEVMEILPISHALNIAEEEDKLIVTASYERGSIAMILLEAAHETRAYYINTAGVYHLAMCSGAFLEEDEKVIKYNINKKGLKGAYTIKIIINDKKYQSGVTIFCND